ncbi:MAG TPA: GH116 family glycosyl hydrolase [bacterium]|nr:GH116 family glycosyl hydrolase [bacterium]HPR88004.1 GH116 family glycosyl hydrolase [bacterium]
MKFKSICWFCLLSGLACTRPEADNSGNKGKSHEFNGVYRGEYLNRIAFPLGGIGAGMISLEGTGALSQVSVRNTAAVFNEPLLFAAISVKGVNSGARVLEGSVPKWKYYGRPNTARGGERTSYGLPRFRGVTFLARFPFARLELEDPHFPLQVSLTGWSPFIPGDADNSSLPVAALEYTFRNRSAAAVEAVFSFHSENFMREGAGENAIAPCANGFILRQQALVAGASNQGDMAFFTDQPATVVDHCWFRGGWWDPLTMAWKNVETTTIPQNPLITPDAPGASLYVPLKLEAGETRTIRLMAAWYVPNSDLRLGQDPAGTPQCEPASGCCASPYYQPWYSGKFASVSEVAHYWNAHYSDLREKSGLFSDAFFTSSLPPEVLEAVAANLSILKSPTLLRQRDGNLWAWEGCNDNSGCCEGSCTHVWNYAQAIPHLFPALERSLRHTEFMVSQNQEGHQAFRSALPIRPKVHDFHAAADGQLGGIMKVYREWRISGDTSWMTNLFPRVEASLDYCIATWDPRRRGILEEPHHNTYDIEFWGPDGMCTSFYLGALQAISIMGDTLHQDVSPYKRLFESGKLFMQDSLYDGEYFYQKIRWHGLNAPDPVTLARGAWNANYSEEARLLLEKEGPKYQYGRGCLSDGVLGFWLARVCGMADPLAAPLIKSHLDAVYTYNLKHDLSGHVNPQRPTYALGDEGGLLLCSWPKGGKLSLPFVYSNEVWTGIEYQVASHLMLMGEVEKGLDIVRTCRQRYDGRVRNPFDEYECGHWYARALSSYGLLQGLTGVRFDAVDQTLYMDSRIGDFTCFLATDTGFGQVGLKAGRPFVHMVSGVLNVKRVMVAGIEEKLQDTHEHN